MKSTEVINQETIKRKILWEAAVPLAQAPMHFANSAVRKRWDKAGKPNILDVIASSFTDEDIVAAARSEILIEAQAQLLAQLKTGQIIALGFEPPRKLGSVPAVILTKKWNISVDWAASKIEAEGLFFVAVRILTQDMGRKILARRDQELRQAQETENAIIGRVEVETPVPSFELQAASGSATPSTDKKDAAGGNIADPTKKMGRPSYRKEIVEAYTALSAEGRFIFKPLTGGMKQIRIWIKTNRKNTPAGNATISNDTFRKILIPLIKSENQQVVEKL